MEIKIMLAAAIFFVGWLLCYVFVRQLLFNFTVAYPTIRKMQALSPDLIAVGAKRYTTTSVLVCSFITLLVAGIIVWRCPTYLIISFFVGAALCLVMIAGKVSPGNRAMFENFCTGYCRFVPDDELRTIMYSKDIKKINRRLRELGCDSSFVPEFKNQAG